MTKTPRHNQKSMQRLLESNGWTKTLGGLPHDKGGGGYPVGLTVAIMKQAGLRGGGD